MRKCPSFKLNFYVVVVFESLLRTCCTIRGVLLFDQYKFFIECQLYFSVYPSNQNQLKLMICCIIRGVVLFEQL